MSRKKGNEDGHISNLEVRIARNKTNIGHISQRRETYSAESARKVADLERKAAALQNELNVSVESNYSDEHIRALEKHLESTKIQIADTIRSNDQSIGNLTLEITDLTNEIGIFEQRLASHSHEADILHTEFRRIHARQQELVGQADSKLTISASKRSHGERAVEKAQEAVSNAQTKLAQEQKRTEEARKRVNILPNQIKRIRSSSADDALRFAHGKVSSTVWSQLFQALEQAGQSMRGAIHKRMDLTKELYPYVMHLWHLSSAAVGLQNQYADLAFLDLLTDTNERAHPLTKEALALTDKVRTINHRANQRVREIERTQQALTSTIDHALKANAFEELKPAIEQVCETMEQLKVLRSDHTDDARAAQKELEVLARVLSDVEEIVEGPKEVLSRFNSGIKGLTGAPEKVATIGIATKKLLSVAKDERLQHAIDAYSSPAYTDTIEGIDRVIELLQDQLSGAVMQAVDQRDPTEVSNGHTDVPTDDIPAGGDSAKAKTTRKKVVTVTIMLIVIVGLLGALALAFARVQASPSSNVDAPTTTPLASLVPITTTTTTLTTTTVGGRTESPITNTEESRPKNAASATTSRDTTAISIPGNPGDTVNCGDFASWKEAQDWFDTYAPHYGDVAFMDINDNGVACEKLLPEGVNVAEVLDRQRVGGDVDPSPPSDGGEPTVEDGGQGGP